MRHHNNPHPSAAAVIRFWGVRGSIPTPGPSTLRYGGNTSCIELRVGKELIIVDAGSGIRALGNSLMHEFGGEPISLTILNTHTHWDHIQGFPFFTPAYIPTSRIRMVGSSSGTAGLQAAYEKQMDGNSCFPVPLKMMEAKISFENIDLGEGLAVMIGGVAIRPFATRHPGLCTGFRIETSAGPIVLLSDHESVVEEDPQLVETIRGAKVLIADCQYDCAEMASRRGWGHGCITEVVALACRAGAEQLYLYHHDPAHGDDFLDGMLARARDLAAGLAPQLRIELAAEGREIVI
ncbi:MAG: MBL fold metallo-hydrolase [Verrucomicrobiota bacterium]